MRKIMVVLVACLVLTQRYSAATTQTVGGTVVDTAGAAVPGATISLQASNAVKRTSVTDASGNFQFTDVPIGRLTITAALAGFKTEMRTLQLSAQRPITTRIVLAVAAVEETVAVTGESPAAGRAPQ